MWKRVVGGDVLDARLDDDYNRTLRAYAHRGAPPSPWPAAAAGGTGAVALIVVNLGDAPRNVSVVLGRGSASRTVAWSLTAGAAGAGSLDALMNGAALPASIADGQGIETIPVDGIERDGAVLSVAPLSVTFAVALAS